jgi:hypothetical protein
MGLFSWLDEISRHGYIHDLKTKVNFSIHFTRLVDTEHILSKFIILILKNSSPFLKGDSPFLNSKLIIDPSTR